MKRSASDKALLIFRVILSVLLLTVLVYLSATIVSSYIEDSRHVGESGYFSGSGFVVFIVILFSLIGNGVLLALAGVGVLLAFVLKNQTNPKKSKILSFLFLVFPIVSEVLLLLLLTLIGKIV